MKKIYKILIIIISLIIIIFCAYKVLKEPVLKSIFPKKYSQYIEKYSEKYNADDLLIYSIIKAESNFDSNAVSSSGAKGLMQLMDETAKEMEKKVANDLENENLDEIEKNIILGINYFTYLNGYYEGNFILALAAYNAGIGNVDTWISSGIIKKDGSDIENIPFKETNMYVRKIINNYKMYKKIYKD